MGDNLHYPSQQDLIVEIQKRIYTAILIVDYTPSNLMRVRRELESVVQDIRHITAIYYFEDDLLLLLFKFLNFSIGYLEYLVELNAAKQYKMSA